MNLPIDVVNKILISRPRHPVAELLKKEELDYWRAGQIKFKHYRNYFYKIYFNKHKYKFRKMQEKREWNYRRKAFFDQLKKDKTISFKKV